VNKLLVSLFQREQDAEIAKMEYLVNSLTLLHGIPAKQYEGKMKALQSFKEAAAEVLYQDVYSAAYLASKKAVVKADKKREADLLKKVQEMGKK
jgi:hypothetical protein